MPVSHAMSAADHELIADNMQLVQAPSWTAGQEELPFEELSLLIPVCEGDEPIRPKFVLQIRKIKWLGPHTPSVQWVNFRSWVKAPTDERLLAAQRKALQSTRFFQLCEVCGERKNVGYMYRDELCQHCAERTMGVVY